MENSNLNLNTTAPIKKGQAVPITDTFIDALIAERDAARLEAIETKAQFLKYQLAAESEAKLLENQRGAWLAIMADPIKAIIKAEMVAYADDFDISAYEDDIRDSFDFNLSDHSSEIEDIVRDMLRATTVTLDV